MIVLHALDGNEVDVNEAAVTLVAGPYPHDLGPHTYVHGVDRGVLVTTEDPAALVARLGVDPPLVKLTPRIRRRFGSRARPSLRSVRRSQRNHKVEAW